MTAQGDQEPIADHDCLFSAISAEQSRTFSARRKKRPFGRFFTIRELSMPVTHASARTESMAQHPGSATPHFALHRLLSIFSMIMSAACMVTMRLRLAWLMSTALIAFPGRTITHFHQRKLRRRDHPLRLPLTVRALRRLFIFRDLAQLAERTALDANIFIDRHDMTPQYFNDTHRQFVDPAG
jgi:hypothetical protein